MKQITPPIVTRFVVVAHLFLFGCASFDIPSMVRTSAKAPDFPYLYYVVEPDGYKGREKALDLGLDSCEAVGSCMMMRTEDFYAMKTEFQSLKLKVINRELQAP